VNVAPPGVIVGVTVGVGLVVGVDVVVEVGVNTGPQLDVSALQSSMQPA
jgi:hypothetical protein